LYCVARVCQGHWQFLWLLTQVDTTCLWVRRPCGPVGVMSYTELYSPVLHCLSLHHHADWPSVSTCRISSPVMLAPSQSTSSRLITHWVPAGHGTVIRPIHHGMNWSWHSVKTNHFRFITTQWFVISSPFAQFVVTVLVYIILMWNFYFIIILIITYKFFYNLLSLCYLYLVITALAWRHLLHCLYIALMTILPSHSKCRGLRTGQIATDQKQGLVAAAWSSQ